MKEIFRFKVGAAENRKRFDEFLFERIGAVSKMHLRNLLLNDYGKINGNPEKPGHRLKKDDMIEFEADLSAETSMKPEPISLEIIFEDQEIIIVNKPAEMLVHPTRGVKSGTLLNALSFYLNKDIIELNQSSGDYIQTPYFKLSSAGDEIETMNPPAKFIRPGLIHRLDKKTSGLMIIAKTPRAHKVLSDHFTRKLVKKSYFAIVEGLVVEDSGVINAPIGYDEISKQWGVLETGKAAETRFRVIKRMPDATFLGLEPVTGRTNQLRIHTAFCGHPIIGDITRGGRDYERLCLHAAKLGFHHPGNNEWLEFETPSPF